MTYNRTQPRLRVVLLEAEQLDTIARGGPVTRDQQAVLAGRFGKFLYERPVDLDKITHVTHASVQLQLATSLLVRKSRLQPEPG
jgi:hypothetical protein